MRTFSILFISLIIGLFSSASVLAHVPYFEKKDFSQEKPFIVKKTVEQSIAVYSWIESQGSDIDVYNFTINESKRVYIQALVPVCSVYDDFLPSFALIGPELPLPDEPLPFTIPDGYGAIIVHNLEPGEERPSFYEFFGNKDYYEGPLFDQVINVPGIYSIYIWDPFETGGDYVAIIGNKEIWGFDDVVRAFIYTPLIRQGYELHSDLCRE